MILSVPILAKLNFISLCHDAYNCFDENNFKEIRLKAKGYSQAIHDICGVNVWGEIVREADLSFPKEVEVCAGIPTTFNKRHKICAKCNKLFERRVGSMPCPTDKKWYCQSCINQ